MCHTHSPDRWKVVLVVWKSSTRYCHRKWFCRESFLRIEDSEFHEFTFCSDDLCFGFFFFFKKPFLWPRSSQHYLGCLFMKQSSAALSASLWLSSTYICKFKKIGIHTNNPGYFRCQLKRSRINFTYKVEISLYIFLLQCFFSPESA